MGIELELAALYAVHVLGTSIFAVFEVETPWWRLTLKWAIVAALVVLVYLWAGHWALLMVAFPGVLGGTFHFIWCRRNGIHPTRATPRRKYYELRGWDWPE